MIELSEQRIDDLSEEFESCWDFKTAGHVGLLNFLASQELEAQVDRRLAVVLIQVDIERSWMAWSKHVEKIGNETDAVQLIEQLSQMPSIDKYSDLFRSQSEFTDSLDELASCEFACRSQWGDSIGSRYYEHHFGISITDSDQSQLRQVRCEFDPSLRNANVAFPLNGKNALGRQRSTDKLSSFVEQLPDGNRIVVADRLDAEISRNQLDVRLLTHKYAIATNVSSVNPVLVSDFTKLQPSEGRLLSFPFSIGLPGRKLFFSYCG